VALDEIAFKGQGFGLAASRSRKNPRCGKPRADFGDGFSETGSIASTGFLRYGLADVDDSAGFVL
jgi:hypothetical protein